METLGAAVEEGWGPLVDDDAKLAFIVPGPFIVALVEADEMSAMDIEPDSVQDVKEYPGLATVDMGSTAPALYQLLPDGVITPSVVLTENVTSYWFV